MKLSTRSETRERAGAVLRPRVLLLDEPFECIDPVSSVTIRDLLTVASGRGIAVFLTSRPSKAISQRPARARGTVAASGA